MNELDILISDWLLTRQDRDFAAITQYLEPFIAKTMFAYCDHPEDAEDLCQDFFKWFCEFRHQLRVGQYKVNYFVKVAANMKLDAMRRGRTRSKYFEALPTSEIDETFALVHDILGKLIAGESGKFVDEWVSSLKTSDQRLLQVYLFENDGEVSRKEAAALLERSENSLRKRYLKLLKMFGEYVEKSRGRLA